MAESTSRLHLRFWLITAVVFAGLLWLFSGMLLPFVLGMAVAYFLDPLVRRMRVLRLSRGMASLLVLLSFIGILAGLSVVLVPLIRVQIDEFLTTLPGDFDALQQQFWPRIKDTLVHIPGLDTEKLQSGLTAYGGDAMKFFGRVLGHVLTGSMALLDILALFLVTPIVAFYMMRDWPLLVQRLDSLIPPHLAPNIHRVLGKIDQMIAGFIRGQATVSLCLAALYSIGLSLVGLKYGMVIGLVGGLLSFIPIVGSVCALTTAMIVACMQFTAPGSILAVVAVFAVIFTFDSNFMTPKLVGDRVGLHPLWIMFAILAGGKLCGFLGVVLAVPTAGTVAILLGVGLDYYRRSRFFDGRLNPNLAGGTGDGTSTGTNA